MQALARGYPVLSGEPGHFLALVPVTDSERAQGYKFRIMDSAKGRDGVYRSVQDAINRTGVPHLNFNAIIYPY